MQQVHGNVAVVLNAETLSGVTADAAVATERGLACTIMVADCLPILLVDRRGTCVVAIHAGWRGLCGGVVEAAIAQCVRAMNLAADLRTDVPPAPHLMAWLGPCIGPDAFEVGAEVRAAFVAQTAGAARHFRARSNEKYMADLAGLARDRLASAGVDGIYGNDSAAAWCTVTNETRFFSYRRAHKQGKRTGRLAACIWRV